nr:MAG TPA: terminase large subunit [Caudoviricetes sp.]
MSSAIKRQRYYLPDLVGKGYGTFWRFRGRYRVVKGSRRSKKSKTAALWYIYNMMAMPGANLLVVRKTYRTLKDSCYTELKWAIGRLGAERWWSCKESPLEMTYLPTGQRIYFRGLDDPLKVTSITVEKGALCWMWVEEAYEISREEDFDTLAESLMGDLPDGLYRQITLTFNPWNERTWIRRRFFCDPAGKDSEGRPVYQEREGPISADGEILAITTTYQCNEWLSPADVKEFERMRERNPRRYRVAGLGLWGVTEGLIYENWREEAFELSQVQHCKTVAGLDFGYTNDPSAFFIGFLDAAAKRLYVWDEMYEKGLSNRRIYERITAMGYGKERVTGDSSEPKSIDELRGLGLRITGAKKGRDSVANGIQWIQDLEIIVHPRCVNFLTEIGCYAWATDRFGKRLNEPIDDFNHLMDAMRYALEEQITGGGSIRAVRRI